MRDERKSRNNNRWSGISTIASCGDLTVIARAGSETRAQRVHLEKGRYNPSLRLAYAISRALHSTIEDVFSFDDENDSVT